MGLLVRGVGGHQIGNFPHLIPINKTCQEYLFLSFAKSWGGEKSSSVV